MKKYVIAFDVDGTLIQNGALAENEIVANERIRDLLIIMSHMKNTIILVWSGGGELWARQAVSALGLQKYVDRYASKNLVPEYIDEPLKERLSSLDAAKHPQFAPDIKPDIAIDDIQDCELGS